MENKSKDIFINNLKDRLKENIKSGMTKNEIDKAINNSINYQFWNVAGFKHN